MIEELRKKLDDTYNITQFEPINSFLGINIEYDQKNGTLSMDVASKIHAMFAEKPMIQNPGRSNIPLLITLPDNKRDTNDALLNYLSDPKNYASIVRPSVSAFTYLLPADPIFHTQ